jgi:hypothetical protein
MEDAPVSECSQSEVVASSDNACCRLMKKVLVL